MTFKREKDEFRKSRHVNRAKSAVIFNEEKLYDLLEDDSKEKFYLILDGVQDPRNLGACLRTADAAGVKAVIIPKDRAVSMTDVVRETASGAAENVPLIAVTNLGRTIDLLKEKGVWLVGTSDKADRSIYDVDMKGNIAVVVGAEGKGIRRLTEEKCDFLSYIPMKGSVSCLNVSVATGVCLFEALRQREN